MAAPLSQGGQVKGGNAQGGHTVEAATGNLDGASDAKGDLKIEGSDQRN